MNELLTKSRMFRLIVCGDNACFTRPEMKVERVSYDVMTPSAARGVLEAILWKPAMRWHVEQIDVLQPIRWESVRRNEVGSTMSSSGNSGPLFIEEKRQQRASLLLREVAYTIHARFELTKLARPDEDNIVKFQEMFNHRASKGKCFNQPYLGCREFAARFELLPSDAPFPEPINESRDLGFMLYDICHDAKLDKPFSPHSCTEQCHPTFFRAQMEKGSVKVPKIDSKEVLS